MNGYIEGRYRFIANNEFRFYGQSPGDTDALALAPAELMRIAVDLVRAQSDTVQQLPDPFLDAVSPGQIVDVQRLGNDITDIHSWIEGAVGILEDNLHLPTQLFFPLSGKTEYVPSVQKHLSLRGGQQIQDQPAQGRLTAAAFTDQPHGFTASQTEGDPVDCFEPGRISSEKIFLHRKIFL